MELCCRAKNNIAIVGAGPAGVFCALNILEEFKKVNFSDFSITIFDKSQALRTILPTGGGRCNISNSIADVKEFCSNYPRGEKFLYSIFSKYFTFDTLEYFRSIGIKTYTQPDGRIFPLSNSAKEVKDKMLQKLKSYKNIKLVNRKINSSSDLEEFDKIVLSAGSRGTKGLIESFNHSCIDFKRALCALRVENPLNLKGVSVRALDGDFVFTDNGISGPLAFKISSFCAYKDFPYEISINLFKYEDLIEAIKKNSKKSIGNIVSGFVPRSLACEIVKDFNKKASEVSHADLKKYTKLNLKVVSTSFEGEIVNAGGVDLDEVDNNIKSKINKNLWFCGEILNIDGLCGGFNLQNCWSGAAVVAFDIVRSIIK